MGEDNLAAYRLLLADVYELAGESRRTSEGLARELDQTAARWHLLSVVSDGPRTVAGAARRLGLTRQSVQRVVDGLAVSGEVELLDNPDHVRASLVTLTDQGRRTLAALVQRGDADRQAVLEQADVGVAELTAARVVLGRLLRALGGLPAPASRSAQPRQRRTRVAGDGRGRGR